MEIKDSSPSSTSKGKQKVDDGVSTTLHELCDWIKTHSDSWMAVDPNVIEQKGFTLAVLQDWINTHFEIKNNTLKKEELEAIFNRLSLMLPISLGVPGVLQMLMPLSSRDSYSAFYDNRSSIAFAWVAVFIFLIVYTLVGLLCLPPNCKVKKAHIIIMCVIVCMSIWACWATLLLVIFFGYKSM